ncbi:unnamed protein product, partial [Natator depressus]
TNWLDQILNDLEIIAAKHTEEEMNERINITSEFLRLEFGDPEKFKRMKELPFRRIIVTHLPPQVLLKSIFKSKAKILLLVQNLKDTGVSYFLFTTICLHFPPSAHGMSILQLLCMEN